LNKALRENGESGEPIQIFERITKKNGEVIVKKYIRGKVLGKGGFATCYELTDVEKNKTLAAKIIQKASLTKKRALEKVTIIGFVINCLSFLQKLRSTKVCIMKILYNLNMSLKIRKMCTYYWKFVQIR